MKIIWKVVIILFSIVLMWVSTPSIAGAICYFDLVDVTINEYGIYDPEYCSMAGISLFGDFIQTNIFLYYMLDKEITVDNEIAMEKLYDELFYEQQNMNVINNRDWAISTEDKENHENFITCMKNMSEQNFWYGAVKTASIQKYNTETEIGIEVDGYELAGLITKLQILDGVYSPTKQEKKMHDWAFSIYEIPNQADQIKSRISDLTLNADFNLVMDLIDSTHNLVNLGVVSSDLKKDDSGYWSNLPNEILNPQDGSYRPQMFWDLPHCLF